MPMTIIDLALDGTPGDAALIVDGVRLVDAIQPGDESYEDLRIVFNKLVRMQNELLSLRKWKADVEAHLANYPRPPTREV